MAQQSETIRLLTSIDNGIKALLARTAPAASGQEVAPDSDLDGQHGDPVVKFIPRDWQGDNFKGCNFSTCAPEFLDLLASSFDYFARKNEESGATSANGKPKAPFDRREAARARGWAKRIRAGWKPAAVPPLAGASDFGGDPFLNSEFPPVAGTLTDDEIAF